VAIAWVLREPAVSSAILGATSVAQLEANVKALDVKLSDAEWREVGALTAAKRAKAAARKPAAKKRRRAAAKS
jgi:aryl-alcohol dehydrogenase-like predicted oxidoreductase